MHNSKLNIYKFHVTVFVIKLLRNNLINFYEIFCVYLVGLRIDCKLYFISLGDNSLSTWQNNVCQVSYYLLV